jgi:hypothetical protein
MTGITYSVGNMEELRTKVGEWAKRNFSDTIPKENPQAYGMLRCTAGMAEELSEMIESGYGLTTTPTDQEEYLDAIADICVYALDFCFTAGLPMQDVLLHDKETNRWEKRHIQMMAEGHQRESIPVLHEGLTVLIGKLAHSCLKMTQDIRRKEDHWENIRMSMCHVWRCCYRVSAWAGKDLNELVHEVAYKVIQRDWKKNRDNAHEVVDANG